LNIHDFVRLLRTRWAIICVTVVVAMAGAVAYSLITTPLYEASTRLYVSTTSDASATEIYSGTLSSQQRVLSYTQLVTGETLAQRTVDRLHLDMSAKALKKNVTAKSPVDTVLIDVSVVDPSPIKARDIADGLSDEFVELVKELETSPEGGPPDVRVVVEQHASLPNAPVSPKKTRNLGLGLALGVLLGIGLALLRDRLDNTVKNQQIAEEITGAGLVANIPTNKERRKNPVILFENDFSPIAEAFRTFRTNLQFLDVDNPPRVLVVSGSLPDEGKTTTAMNLALALAEAEHNVVLVDGDMRRPKLHQYLDLIGSVGFSTVLSGRASLEEVLQKTRYRGLTVLTSGAIPPNPSELLGSMAAAKVLNELRTRFDFVVIDSSPLLAVTDAAILAADADGVLVVARFGETKREQLAHAVGNLKNVGARILGAVFTMSPTRGEATYNYKYYGEKAAEGRRSPSRRATRTGVQRS
jgi:capsular exopolysaccharide synthesis family protein